MRTLRAGLTAAVSYVYAHVTEQSDRIAVYTYSVDSA